MLPIYLFFQPLSHAKETKFFIDVNLRLHNFFFFLNLSTVAQKSLDTTLQMTSRIRKGRKARLAQKNQSEGFATKVSESKR